MHSLSLFLISLAVGKPIHVDKTEEPSTEQIDDLHQRYIQSLQELFETHKEEYGVNEKQHLQII